MTTTPAATPVPQYFRTLHGSHRHLNWFCANIHRSVFSGDVIYCSAGEAAILVPCAVCAAAELQALECGAGRRIEAVRQLRCDQADPVEQQLP